MNHLTANDWLFLVAVFGLSLGLIAVLCSMVILAVVLVFRFFARFFSQ